MRRLIFLLALWSPVLGWGQVQVGGYVGAFDCNMAGKYTGVKSRAALGGAIWAEWGARDWFGLKSELSYLPRGGDVEGVGLDANYLGFSVVPRLRLSESDSRVRLVVGAGVFTHLLPIGDKASFVSTGDVGPCVELGLEWPWFSILAKGQIGVLDVLSDIEKGQRWVAFGVGVEVPFVGL